MEFALNVIRLKVRWRRQVVVVFVLFVSISANMHLAAAAQNENAARAQQDRTADRVPESAELRLMQFHLKMQLLASLGQYSKVRDEQQELCALLEKHLPHNHWRVVDNRVVLKLYDRIARMPASKVKKISKAFMKESKGTALLRANKVKEARECLQVAVIRMEELLGKQSSACSTVNYLLSHIESQLGNFRVAAQYAKQAAESTSVTHGKTHFFVGRNLQELAWAQIQLGNSKAAEANLTAAQSIITKSCGNDHPLVMFGLAYLSICAAKAGRGEDANAHAKAFAKEMKRLGLLTGLPQGSPEDVSNSFMIVVLFAGRQMFHKADVAARIQIAAAEKKLESIPAATMAKYYQSHAYILKKLGQKAESRLRMRRARQLSGKTP